MQLAPFEYDPCAGCPFWGLCYRQGLDSSTLLLEELGYGTLEEALTLYDEADALGVYITDPDIVAYEAEMAWEAYAQDDKSGEQEAPTQPTPTTPRTLLEKRLASMAWLRTTQPGRRPSSKRFIRHGQRYRVVQDHGTARRRDGIQRAHQYHAEVNDNGMYYQIAQREKAAFRTCHEDAATWCYDPAAFLAEGEDTDGYWQQGSDEESEWYETDHNDRCVATVPVEYDDLPEDPFDRHPRYSDYEEDRYSNPYGRDPYEVLFGGSSYAAYDSW